MEKEEMIDDIKWKKDYRKMREELQNAEASETLNGTKLIYEVMEFGRDRVVGTPMPIFEDGTSKVKELYVCLDPAVETFPYEVKTALVEHEKIHFSGDRYFLPDRKDDENRLIVDTMAYLETGNPVGLVLPYIRKEVRSFIKNRPIVSIKIYLSTEK